MTTHAKTENDAAADWLCPLARTFADKNPAISHCRGSACPLWRWEPIPASTLTEAVKKRQADMKEAGDKGGHKEAVAWVMERREELGIPTEPTHGRCGLGG